MRIKSVVFLLFVFACTLSVKSFASDKIHVGFAKVDVTPKVPVVLAGYGGRTRPFESIDTKLFARAMVIDGDEPVAIVVLDNCGVTKDVTLAVRKQLSTHGFRPNNVVVATTHTHNAPALVGYAPILWQGRMTEEMSSEMAAYTQFAIKKMAEMILSAKKVAEPLELSWGQGLVTFGGNRRVINDGKWGGFGFQMDAPVDHSLPIIVAKNEQGIVKGIWANYACHCTTVGSRNAVGGDWAGFANEEMEKVYPSAISLMSIGCGADVGPQPSGNIEIARRHGKAIAAEVNKMIASKKLQALKSLPSTRAKTINLPLEKPKPKSHWETLAKGRGFDKELAIKMLEEIEKKGGISNSVEYPITIWSFGKDLAIVFMPGEVVVDYAVRLKSELDWERLWITGWANRMPGYIPSRKVLMQGGYEAEFSQVYYGLPGRYKPEVENLISRSVVALAGKEFETQLDSRPSPYHKLPSRESLTFAQFKIDYQTMTEGQKSICHKVCSMALAAKPAVSSVDPQKGRRTQWFDLYGDSVPRVFMRQDKGNEIVSWKSPQITDEKTVLCFSGGLGYLSQPQTSGFVLQVSNGDFVRLDVVREPTVWQSDKKTFDLFYVPTWKSDLDSAGVFFVVFKDRLKTEKSIAFSMKSKGKGSLRWFGLDAKQNTKDDLSKLVKLLDSVKEK